MSRFKREPSTKDRIRHLFNQAVENYAGLAVSEDWHGAYAYPLFLKDMMADFAERNVRRLYIEFVPASKQNLLDQWQDKGDESGITGYLNTRFFGYSRRMWQHYWVMMKEANANGIRVVGVDNPEIQSGYGAIFDAPFKTMHWEGIIYKDRQGLPPDEKFVVYGGEMHATDMGGTLISIHQHLNIPRMMMRAGEYSVAPLPLDRQKSYIVSLPPAPKQDPLSRALNVRNIMVNSPL